MYNNDNKYKEPDIIEEEDRQRYEWHLVEKTAKSHTITFCN